MGSGQVSCCAVCDDNSPKWTIVRQGDVVVSWACNYHLVVILNDLQRDHEVTELVVTLTAKAREVAEINRMIRETMPPREATG